VRRQISAGIAANAGTDRVVVLESPLLIETGMHRDCDVVVVVAADPDTRVARLVARGMDEADARARMAAQGSLEAASAAADVLLDNDGRPGELEAQVERLWEGLRTRAGSAG
jgi:dephospho-CoA kinase